MHTSLNVLLHSVSYVDLKIIMHVTMCMYVYRGNHVTNVHENKDLVKQMILIYTCNKCHVDYVHVTIDLYYHDHATIWLRTSTCTCKCNVIIVHQ